MGRYSQRQRRGGGPPPPPSAPPITVLAVSRFDDFSYTWTFSADVATLGVPAACQVEDGEGGWASPGDAFNSAPNMVTMVYAVNPSPGAAWQMPVSPAPDLDAAAPFTVPEDGVIGGV